MRLHLPGHGDFTFVREGAYATLAFYGRAFLPGRTYEIDGTEWAVVSSGPSKYVPTVTVVTLKEV